MRQDTQEMTKLGELGWGVFLILIASVVFVVTDFPLGPITIISIVIALLFTYAYPYVAFGLLVALIPFQGAFISIPVDVPTLGERLFGGSVDLPVGELVAIVVLIAWGLRTIAHWIGRNDPNWEPWLPFFWPMMAIFATHLLSGFSTFNPDTVLVLKYAIRPVLWCYVVYVALTANAIRSPRRLRMILGVITITGIFSALMGFVSLWFPQAMGQPFPRAVPFSIFGVSLLGENHNALAEWLVVTVSSSIALMLLTKSERLKRMLKAVVVFQIVIALLTFARTLWIVFFFEAIIAGWFIWRDLFRKYLPIVLISGIFLFPLAVIMTSFSASTYVQSSTSTRVMLTQIALNVWKQSPWIGAGAGTFVERIGATTVFLIEYGAPLDSHGWIQKLLAEVGLIGLSAVIFFFWRMLVFIYRELQTTFKHASIERDIFLIFAITVFGEGLYQLFDTSYWSGKMWLPVGILFAISRIFKKRSVDQ
jgi:hypothetical protein